MGLGPAGSGPLLASVHGLARTSRWASAQLDPGPLLASVRQCVRAQAVRPSNQAMQTQTPSVEWTKKYILPVHTCSIYIFFTKIAFHTQFKFNYINLYFQFVEI